MEREVWKAPHPEVPEGHCTICRVEIHGRGNSPKPVKSEGKCCDKCNLLVVMPHRFRASGASEEQVKEYFDVVLAEEAIQKEEDRKYRMKKALRRRHDAPRSVRIRGSDTSVIVAGGDIIINGKKVKSKDSANPEDYENWLRRNYPYEPDSHTK